MDKKFTFFSQISYLTVIFVAVPQAVLLRFCRHPSPTRAKPIANGPKDPNATTTIRSPTAAAKARPDRRCQINHRCFITFCFQETCKALRERFLKEKYSDGEFL